MSWIVPILIMFVAILIFFGTISLNGDDDDDDGCI
jgi:hypothetical protein